MPVFVDFRKIFEQNFSENEENKFFNETFVVISFYSLKDAFFHIIIELSVDFLLASSPFPLLKM